MSTVTVGFPVNASQVAAATGGPVEVVRDGDEWTVTCDGDSASVLAGITYDPGFGVEEPMPGAPDPVLIPNMNGTKWFAQMIDDTGDKAKPMYREVPDA